MSNNSQVCNISTSLTDNSSFTVSHFVLLFLGFVSTLLNGLLIAVLRRPNHLDENICLLLIYMSFATIVGSVYQFVKSIYIVAQLSIPCGLVMNLLTCKLVEAIYLSSGFGVIWSALAMGVDRLLATRKPDSYTEDWGRIIPTFVVVSWLLGVGISLITATIQSESNAQVPHCNIIIVAPINLIIIVAFLTISSEFLLAAIYISVWLYNKRYLKDFSVNTAAATLRARFQLHRNMRAARIMLPNLAVHCCIWVVVSLSVVTARLCHTDNLNLYLIGQYSSDGLVLLHALLHPPICFIFNKELMNELKTTLGCAQLKSTVGVAETVENPNATAVLRKHFDLLTTTWGSNKIEIEDRGV